MKTNHPVFAPSFQAFSTTGYGTVFYVSNTTNPADGQGSPGPDTKAGRSPKSPFTSLTTAISEAVGGRGDVIVLQRGTYSVSDLSVNKAGLSFVGAPVFGYPDQVVLSGEIYVTASNVSFYHMEFFSNSADEAAVSVGLTSAGGLSEVDGSYFEDCSFASNGTTEPEYGLRIFGGNNHTIKNCYFIDQTRALCLRSGQTSMVSHVTLEDTEFHENTTYDIGTGGTTGTGGGTGQDQGVRNAVFKNNIFASGTTPPTTFVTISGTSSGSMAGNVFGVATNDISVIVIPSGILYPTNATEAGWSTARPA